MVSTINAPVGKWEAESLQNFHERVRFPPGAPILRVCCSGKASFNQERVLTSDPQFRWPSSPIAEAAALKPVK